jgi:DNA repair protein RecN (Recombination protein N)
VAAIHGQHEPQGLLDPDTHLPLLDHHAHLGDKAAEVAAAFRRLREADEALRTFHADLREAERRRDMLAFQAKEIEAAALQPGEDEALRREKQVQANAGRLAGLRGEAYALLYEDEDAVLARLSQVYKRLEELARIDARFEPYLDARLGVRAHLEDLALFLRDYGEQLDVTPGRLDEIESRLALVERLKKKYGATVDEVIAYGAVCRGELELLGSPEARLRQLEAEQAEASSVFVHRATELSRARRKAASAFGKQVERELAELALERTRVSVAFTPETVPAGGGDPASWTERGLETAEFLIAPNAGEEARPLARIASGGELSRLMLALKSVASLDTPGVTLVFDEVDAGIGGRVAEVVGKKLRAMAARHQVLCVTHLPQIASLADHHFAVAKREERGRTRAVVRSLDGPDRVEEVARMLGGETVTDTARRHAREMVEAARG